MKDLKIKIVPTPLGKIVVIGDTAKVYLLDFVDDTHLDRKIKRMVQHGKIEPGKSEIMHSIERELSQYFAGSLLEFKTTVEMVGTPFQQNVWNQLKKIEIGSTASYSKIAKELDKASAIRAVANAIAANPLLLIIPCHRVIHYNEVVGNYSAGKIKKEWLLSHEAIYQKGI